MDVKQRFSNRVEDYIRYRPSYPDKLLGFLIKKARLRASSHIADIGSGTGKLTLPFITQGYIVSGIEPNEEMRQAAEDLMKDYPNFRSVNGTAEATTLTSGSCQLIMAAQAFHWFDPVTTKKEFQRIIKPGGLVALIWNDRISDTDFYEGYEAVLNEFSTDYHQVNHRNIGEEVIETFFSPAEVETKTFPNAQYLNETQLLGRYLSCSYALTRSDDRFPEAQAALEELFSTYQEEGVVKMDYKTKVYFAKLPILE